MPSATGLGKGAISDNAAELMGVAHRAEEGIQHGLLRLMAHRQQRCAALRCAAQRQLAGAGASERVWNVRLPRHLRKVFRGHSLGEFQHQRLY